MNPSLQKSPTHVPPGLLPVRHEHQRSREKPEEMALRLRPDGPPEEIPVTREILLNPCPEIHILQSDDHQEGLEGLIQRLKRFVEQRPGWRLFSDLSINWPMLTKDIAPDISVAQDVPARKLGKARKTLDVAKEGCRVRTVFEVVSSGQLARLKDEDWNPPKFARAGVDDLVLIYLPNLREPSDPPLRVFSLHGRSPGGGQTRTYHERQPGADGRFLVPSIGVSLGVEGEGPDEELVAYDAATGERLVNTGEAVEKQREEAQAREAAERRTRKEATARKAAERRADDAERQAENAERRTLSATLLRLLGNRGLALSDDARERIENCGDPRQLERWLDQAFSVDSVDDLWKT